MKIDAGRKKSALKGVIYGPEGVGKTTLASHFPDPVFIDLENGTNQMDVKRISTVEIDGKEEPINSWYRIHKAVMEIADSGQAKTIVIDSADVAETWCAYYVCKKKKIDSIAAPDYGKGYVYHVEEFRQLLYRLSKICQDKGINVVLIGHSQLKKFEQPDEYGAYDRYELKLEKKVAQALKEWGDFVLFLNYKVEVVKADGKMGKTYKATGGKRVIYTTHSPTWDAKNRFGLAEELPLSYDSIACMFKQDTPPSIHITDEDKGLLVEESDPRAPETPVIIADEDADDPKLSEIIGDPTVAKIMSRLTEAGLEETDATTFMQSKGIRPVKGDGSKLSDYAHEFLVKNILGKWESFSARLIEKKGK